MRRLTKGYAAAVALSAVALFSACTTLPATNPPSATSPSSAFSSSTPASTPTAGSQTTAGSGQSAIPEAARASTPQGAEAFTRYFIDKLNEGMATANPDILPTLSLASCKSCTSYNTIIREMMNQSQHFVGEWISPVSFAVTEFTPTSASIQATVSQSGRIVSSGGSIVTTAPSQRGDLLFTVSAKDGWRMAEVQVVQK